MAGEFEGAVALVTGAAREDGIGTGAVRALLERGASGVIFTDVDDILGERAGSLLGAEFGARVGFFRQDVTSVADWETTTEHVLERYGRLDIVFNNAGVPLIGNIAATDVDVLRCGMTINFESQYIGIRHTAPILARYAGDRPGGAAIINNSSMAAYLADPDNVAYHVSKAAVRMLTMCAAREFGPARIRVNSVHYGPILTTPMQEALGRYAESGAFQDAESAMEGIARLSPLRRVGTIEDAGALIAFLASDQARFITGAAFVQDGGCFVQY